LSRDGHGISGLPVAGAEGEVGAAGDEQVVTLDLAGLDDGVQVSERLRRRGGVEIGDEDAEGLQGGAR
jgi:hypothetical protein